MHFTIAALQKIPCSPFLLASVSAPSVKSEREEGTGRGKRALEEDGAWRWRGEGNLLNVSFEVKARPLKKKKHVNFTDSNSTDLHRQPPPPCRSRRSSRELLALQIQGHALDTLAYSCQSREHRQSEAHSASPVLEPKTTPVRRRPGVPRRLTGNPRSGSETSV